MKKELRLYLWDGVLTDYYSGVAFALATSPEQAKKQVMKTRKGMNDNWDGIKLDGIEPTVIDKIFGYSLHGGG